jgi:hypothetical protein
LVLDIEMYMSNLFSKRDGLGAKTFVSSVSRRDLLVLNVPYAKETVLVSSKSS